MKNLPLKTNTYALRYGSILGLISVAFGIMIYTLDMHYQGDQKIGIVSLVISIVVIMLGLLAFKKDNGGYIQLSEALKTGIGIALISGLISVVYQFLLVTIVDPDTIEKMVNFQMEKIKLQQPEITPETYDMIESSQKKFTTPWVMVTIGIVFSLFFGFIISLIGGLIIRKSKPETF
tara:strand:+ start:119 stop:649 length:531 start_codon:yes stop_codon:yes gene_type:complete